MRRPDLLVVAYLAAITAANLLVSWLGPPVVAVNAFLFIGLDLVARDQLHEHWQGRALRPRMLALIGAGGLLSLVLGGSGRVALASAGAFVLAGVVDSVAYQALRHTSWLRRVNGSNLAAATVDSLLFPLFAFGWPLLWSALLGQLAAKLLGGGLWAAVLRPRQGHQEHSGLDLP